MNNQQLKLIKSGAALIRSLMHDMRISEHITGEIGGQRLSARQVLAELDAVEADHQGQDARAVEMQALIENASDMNLADGGRYFSETCDNFTACDHGDCGEYTQGEADGKLVQFLWNNRRAICAAFDAEKGTVPEAQRGLPCPNCNKAVLPGQVVFCWNDENDTHADCDYPYSLEVEPDDEGNLPRLFLGAKPFFLSLSAIKDAGK